jgi:hypothetical protein
MGSIEAELVQLIENTQASYSRHYATCDSEMTLMRCRGAAGNRGIPMRQRGLRQHVKPRCPSMILA